MMLHLKSRICWDRAQYCCLISKGPAVIEPIKPRRLEKFLKFLLEGSESLGS